MLIGKEAPYEFFNTGICSGSSTPIITRGMTESINDLNTKHNFVNIPQLDTDYPLGKTIKVCDLLTFITTYLPKVLK